MKKQVTIIGGGIVGMAMAALLAQQKLDTLIIDPAPMIPNQNNQTDLRVYAINHASQKIFNRIGIWQDIVKHDVGIYRNMHVWDQNSSGQLLFDAQTLARSELGFIIEEKIIKNALLEHLQNIEHVTLLGENKLHDFHYHDTAKIHLELGSGESIQTNLVIGADGGNSWLRKKLQFNCQATPYEHHALVCNLETELPHDNTAYQIFTDCGPLAFLPLRGKNQCSIVWSQPEKRINQLINLSDSDFQIELAKSFQNKLGKIIKISKRVNFPLIERVVDPFVKPGVALIGDALHTIHPLAGLGVNLGLGDVVSLADILEQAGDDFCLFKTLRKYERARKGSVLATTKLMKLIKNTFSDQGLIPAPIRAMGMNFITHSNFIKRQIIGFADR